MIERTRRQISVLLLSALTWLIVAPVAHSCPCEGADIVLCEVYEVEESSCCTESPDAYECGILPSEPVYICEDENGEIKCCSATDVCRECPHCQSNILVPTYSDKHSLNDFEIGSAVAVTIPSAYTVESLTPREHRPPDKLHIAPHIASTVLLC